MVVMAVVLTGTSMLVMAVVVMGTSHGSDRDTPWW